MPIYQTHEFWNYLGNEPELIITRAIELLTRLDYNHEEQKDEISTYYQVVFEIEGQRFIKFPAGLSNYISNELHIPIEEKRSTAKEYTEEDIRKVCTEIAKINPHFETRDYQIEACLTSLNRFQTLVSSGVGSGKTSVISMVCSVLKEDYILISNDNNFVLQQIYERLQSFGLTDVSWLPGKTPDFSKRIVLFNTSGSNSKLQNKDESYLEFLQKVNTWIIDEAHGMQAITWFEPLFHMNPDNLRRIIGYTGSPFRNYKYPYKEQQDYLTIALLGEPAFVYEMKDTIADGTIAQPYSYFIRFNNREARLPAHLKDNYYMQYRMNITYNKPRNTAGLEMLKFLERNNIKTLASFNNIKPGQAIMKELAQVNIKSLFICGGNTIHEWVKTPRGALKLETRKGNIDTVKEALKDGYNIIFGSTVMDEGVDISDLQAVVLFSAGKTPIAGIQRIGRASRKRKVGKNVSFVIDFRDIDGHPVFRNQFDKRKQMMMDSGVKNIEKAFDFCRLVEEVALENKISSL